MLEGEAGSAGVEVWSGLHEPSVTPPALAFTRWEDGGEGAASEAKASEEGGGGGG